MSTPFVEPLNVHELERLAQARLSVAAFDYYASGADDELTLRKNREAFARLALHYRVLVDVRERKLATTVLGHPVSLPILFAPTAFHRMAHPDGECATARAASAAGTAMILSTLSTTDVEDVRKSTTGPLFFQLYVYKDRAVTEALVRRVEAAGASALVLTVDAPLLGRRERDVRNRFALPPGLAVKNLVAPGSAHGAVPPDAFDSGLAAYFASLVDASLSWKDLDWLASITKLPVVVKGIVRPDDALRARDHGAKAIVVSNHGGRQLDGSPATLDVLGPIAKALSGSLTVRGSAPDTPGDSSARSASGSASLTVRGSAPDTPGDSSARSASGSASVPVRGSAPDTPGDSSARSVFGSASLELWMDGGVRRGTDVMKALALGARAVLIGRPVLWGLAHDGEAGVRLAVEMLRRELDLAMALAGCPNLAAITPDLVAPHP